MVGMTEEPYPSPRRLASILAPVRRLWFEMWRREDATVETLELTGPNAEQIKYWNQLAGPKWVELQPLLDAQIAALGTRTMDRAGIVPGARVLDVGCGCGHTTIELARRVGPSGSVTGVDISTPMLEEARAAASRADVRNVRFENVDAQTHPFAPDRFDVVFSRFGVMFFAHPEDAFRNLCRALRPGGRLAFVCWQSLQANQWMLVPLQAAAKHIALPPPPAPGAPGPFALADADRVRGILERAGFADLVFDTLNDTPTIGGAGGLDQAVEFLLQMGPLGRLLREADPGVVPRVAAAVREALAPFHTADGIRMGCAAWAVSGRRP